MRDFTIRLANLVDGRATWVLVGLLLLCSADLMRHAAQRPLWFDELLTFHIALLRSPREVWLALLDGADTQPPLGYLLTAAAHYVFGNGELATRLPSIACFTIMSLALYRFVEQRLGVIWGLIAMEFCWLTWTYEFGYEARPYALVLAGGGLALLCWREAAEGERRILGLAGLTMSLAAALASHYYAVLVFAPIGIGELVRWRRAGKVDWAVAASVVLAGSSILVYWPLLEAIRSHYAGTFWNPLEWIDLIGFYLFLLRPAWVGLALIGVFLLIESIRRGSGPDPLETAEFPVHEKAALWALALLPLIAIVLALVSTKAFTYRYPLPAVFGICAFFAIFARSAVRGDRGRGMIVLGILTVTFAMKFAEQIPVMSRAGLDLGRIGSQLTSGNIPQGLPVVVTSPLAYLELTHYAPAAVTPRLFYLVDPDAALQYSGTDSPERNLWQLRRWAQLQVRPYSEFLGQHPRFLLYHVPGTRFSWVREKLADEGETASVLAEGESFEILLCCGP